MLYVTLRQYEYIVGVADAGSLTHAATQLNVSQPSLSVAITRVEHRLGSPIFARGKGATIEITPFGHRFVANARGLLDLAAKTEQRPEAMPTFVLGCFEDIAPWYLLPAVRQLTARFPNIKFQGSEGRFSDIARDLAEGRMDVAISYDVGIGDNFKRRKIEEIAPVAFLSPDHPLASKTSVELGELIHYPMIFFSEDLSAGFMHSLLDRMRLSPIVQQKTASLEMMRSLAAHGVGIGISYSRPPNNISYDGKTLFTIPISTPEAKTDVSLIWSSLRQSDSLFESNLETLA